jgi:menaquinone-dependent protoporphyrinogen oxidase
MIQILVAYASKHDSTAEIAHVIGNLLRESGNTQVDIRSVDVVENLKPYDAVVLGSAVYAGQWQSEAADFLKRFERELAQRRVWIFSSGPTGQGDPNTILKGWEFPQALKPIVDRIKPRDVIVFHGKLDPNKLNFLEKMVVKGVKAPMGDYRDWELIRAWATSIAEALHQMAHA